MKPLAFTTLLALCLAAGSARAQEVLVPFDSSGRIEHLDRSLEDKLNLFPEYPRFVEATLFRLPDSSYVLEIMYEDSAGHMRARRPLSAADAAELRARVMQIIAEKAPAVALDRSGRKALIAGTLTLALAYHGWAIPVGLNVRNGTAVGGLYLVTAAAGYFVPLLATEHISVSRGTASLALYGGSRGIGHGIMLGLVLGGENHGRTLVSAGLLTSIGEELIGGSVAQSNHLSDGDAVAIGVLGDFGAGIGVAMADVAGAFDDGNARAAGAWVLGGSAAGLAAGGLLASRVDYTRGDAYIVRGAGALGALTTVTFTSYAKPNNDHVYTTTAMAGAVGGLVLGHVLIRDHDFTSDQGALVTLGEVSGGLLGLGTVALFSRDDGAGGSAYWTGAMLGAAGGFALPYIMFEKDASVKSPHAQMQLDVGPCLPSVAGQPGFAHLPIPPGMPTATLRVHF
jgi:hypothetical protein